MRTISTLAMSTLMLVCSYEISAQRCIDGFSDGYPCQMTDQLSSLTLALFETQNVNDVWGWTNPETGREYVTLGLFNKTAFIDITSPARPLYIGYLPTQTFGSLWRDIKVRNGYAYIVAEAGGHGMQVFDLTRLESVSYAETPVQFNPDAVYTGFGNAHNIAVDEESGFAYPVGTNTFAGGLHIVDINNPTAPAYAGSSEEDGYTHDAQIVVYNGPHEAYQGRQICFAGNENTITVFDVTDKQDVEMLSRTEYEMIGYTHQCWLTEDHKYLLSNDELDELDFEINTRTIVWDVQDLENPFPIGYVDLGTTSIDHNLYVRDNMAYLSNYTSGLRILDLNNVGNGLLNSFGYFDVVPDNDNKTFTGSWSNYPYFKSEVIPVTAMYSGVHFVKPRYAELETKIIKICGNESVLTVPVHFNQPVVGNVSYSSSMMDSNSPVNGFILFANSQGAPYSNELIVTGISSSNPGYYPGSVTISYSGNTRNLPFVVVKDADETAVPVPAFPIGGVTLNTQNVLFQYDDLFPGYAYLQVAVDPDFETIVYEVEHFGNATEIQAIVPFGMTEYYWRLIKPVSCGDDLVSETGNFMVGLVSSVQNEYIEPSFGIAPNPVVDVAYISGIDGKGMVLELLDISGRKLNEYTVPAGTSVFSLELGGYTAGIYMLRELGAPKSALKIVKR